MKYYFVIASLVILLGVGDIAYAASSKLVLYTEETVTVEDEYGEYEETREVIVHNIEEGGSYPVDLSTEYKLYVASELGSYIPEGYLYFINTEGQRELVANIGGYEGVDSLIWERSGEYELDVYDMERPLPVQSKLEYLFANLLFANVAHAQVPGLYLETIHFTITDENAVAECCSSVVFLPGIKGSVLKTETNTLWPPTIWSTDVSQLAIDENGESEEEVFVDGMLSTFYGTPVYGPFGSFMNTLVADGTIADWEPLPYDWRFSPERILQDGVKTDEDTVVDLIDQIEALASDSHTGQVTIVAHSMGGLMGKTIIKKLQEQGKDNLIDSFIMVGSPQLGTPQAISSILHGQGESILAGQIVDSATSRSVAQNMQSSYNLLPSPQYFEEVADPVITFKENDWYTNDWINKWGSSLNTYNEYAEFVTGKGVDRTDPLPGDLSRPEILQTELVESAEAFHNEFDSYVFPEHIRVVQVAGWGQPTVKTVEYQTRHLLIPAYEPEFTLEGDSTVVYASAIASTVDETYFFNQNKRHEFEHKDLLSAQPIQNVIHSVVQEEAVAPTELLTLSKPEVSEVESFLLVSSHSPVLLGVQDSDGNYTGISSDSDSDLLIKQEIPDSSFIEFGDSQYVFLPQEGTYTFSYEGTDNGSTTIEIETFANDIRTPVVSYSDIPTTPNTKAVFEVDSSSIENSEVEVDQNGDGTVDEVIRGDGVELSLNELILLLKTTISDFDIKTQIKKNLLTKVAVLEKLSTIKNKNARAFSVHLNINILKLEIKFLTKNKKLPQQDAALLLGILNQIKEQL